MGSPSSTPLRRSTRPRRVPVSYAILDEDQVDDIKYTGLPTQHQQPEGISTSCLNVVKAGSDKREASFSTPRTRLMVITRRASSATAGDPPQIHPSHEEVESTDDSDSEYGVKPKKKKLKVEHTYEKILVGGAEDKQEQILRKICSSVGIQFGLFDTWTEDPRLKDPSKMNIPFLPNEIIVEIFGHCRSEVLVQCERSCQRFRYILKDNTRIWRQARLRHYPNPDIGSNLPYSLDEASLFRLAMEKRCVYCKSKKAKPYYAWGTRSCRECLKSLTMSISEFKKMLKKKCDGEEDWTPPRREKLCFAIHWYRNSNYSKICWKEHAYSVIEEAEEEIMAGTFDKWVTAKVILQNNMPSPRPLEEWGSTISKKIAQDRRMDELRVGKLRIACFRDWCMCLPRPIPEKTLKQLGAYWAFLKTSNYPTKSEFIRQLPRLLGERDLFEEKERRKEELKTLYRVRQDSVIDRACSSIVQHVMQEGSLSAISWCAILRGALQQVNKTFIEIKIPRGTPATVFMRSEDWKNDWNGSHLMRLADLLEEKLRSPFSIGIGEKLLHPASYEFFYNGEDRIFACPAAVLGHSSTCHEACKSKETMNFQELVSHLLLTHPHGYGYPLFIWKNPEKAIVVHTAAKKISPLILIGGKQYRQRELQEWFSPLPKMIGTEDPGEWMRCGGIFKVLLGRKMKLGGPSIVANSSNGVPVVVNRAASFRGVNKNNGSKSSKDSSRKSIMTYFHIQKRPHVKS